MPTQRPAGMPFAPVPKHNTKWTLGAIVEILGTFLIVAGVVLGIALGCGVALGVFPLISDYRKPEPRALRNGTGPGAAPGRPTSSLPGRSEDARPSK